ncbi:MAG: DUF3291 domain-containing protein [Acidimicrobiia bacterium]|nr:DUF3291 domain-containing protein [Acidimicrobiia bacterium]
MTWHLAAFNVAKIRHDLDDPRMADFVDNLELVNALGDNSPGFVWRHQTEAGDSTAERIFDDHDILLNFTIWESVDALHQFTYRSDHTDFLRRRREWFEPLDDWPVLVLWWVPAGDRPSLDEAKARLAQLRDEGPMAEAFTFRERFPPPADAPQPYS